MTNKRSRGFRPALETLDDRSLPSVAPGVLDSLFLNPTFMNTPLITMTGNSPPAANHSVNQQPPALFTLDQTDSGLQLPGVFTPGQAGAGLQLPGVFTVGQTDSGLQLSGASAPGQTNSGLQLSGVSALGQVDPGIALAGVFTPGQIDPGLQVPGVSGLTPPAPASQDTASATTNQSSISASNATTPGQSVGDLQFMLAAEFGQIDAALQSSNIVMPGQSVGDLHFQGAPEIGLAGTASGGSTGINPVQSAPGVQLPGVSSLGQPVVGTLMPGSSMLA